MLVNVKEALITGVYQQANRYYLDKLQKIVISNNKAYRNINIYGYFIHNNVKYGIGRPDYFPYMHVPTYDLVESLHADADAYIAESKSLEEEIPIVSRFLTIMLNFVKSGSDIKFILGDALYQLVRNSYLDDPEPRTQEELQAFVNRHQQYIDMINQRYVDNILMSNIYNESKS